MGDISVEPFVAVPGHMYAMTVVGSKAGLGNGCFDQLEDAGPGTFTINIPTPPASGPFGPTATPDFSFFVSGDSTQSGAFLAFAEKLMLPGFFAVYTDQPCGTQGSNYRAVFGTMATTLPDGSTMPSSLAARWFSSSTPAMAEASRTA
jgi:hypothetical protein